MFWEDLARAEARVDVAMLAKLATQEGEGRAATVQGWSAMGLETSQFSIFIPRRLGWLKPNAHVVMCFGTLHHTL